MIVVQSPLRVSLFGGGTDFQSFFQDDGGCVLSTAIDKRIFVTAKHRFDSKLRIGYTRTEMVDDLDQVQHELIRESLRKTGIRDGIEISTMGDIPSAGSGLGSSSTVTVGTLLALYSLSGLKATPERLAQEACEIEIDILEKPIGVQDQYIAAYGGLKFIEFHADGKISVEPVRADPETTRALDKNLMLFYTGVTRKSETVLAEQQANIGERLSILRDIRDLAYRARGYIEQGELDAIGDSLHESWMLKRQLATGISNGQIEEIYETARKFGALGGKITGAGGGGFVLLYCPRKKQPAVREALGQLQELPFRFDHDGAKVILDHKAQENSENRTQTPHMVPKVSSTANGSASILTYLSELHAGLDGLKIKEVERAISLLHHARLERRKIFIMGNGGSASTASHFACDLGKNTRMEGLPDFRVIALTDNLATFSALANDEGYENVFVGQLANLMEAKDIVIGISTSGNSPNIVRAIDFANVGGAQTVGLTGATGGRLAQSVNMSVKVPTQAIEQVEDIHLMLEHLICTALNDRALQERERQSVRERQNISSPSHGAAEETYLDRERVRALYEFNRAFAASNGDVSFARKLLTTTLQRLPAESASVLIVDKEGQLEGGSVAYAGQIHDREPHLLDQVYDEGLAGWVVKEKEAVLVRNTKQDRRWFSRAWEKNSLSSRSAIAAPVLSNGHVMGVVTLARDQESSFSERDLALLKAVTFCASIVT